MQWHDVTRKILGGTGGARQNFGGAVAPNGTPLAPPLLAVVLDDYKKCNRQNMAHEWAQ